MIAALIITVQLASGADPADVIAEYGAWNRAYPAHPRLAEMHETAEATLGRSVPDPRAVYNLLVFADVQLELVLRELRADADVLVAELPLEPVPAPVPPDFTPEQGYAGDAPQGCDVAELGGAGIRVADVEYSWNLDHQDLPLVELLGQPPVDPFNNTDHGTAVLGILGSLDNRWGTTGMAAGAEIVVVAAHTGSWNVGGAIVTAAVNLEPGDVIVVEQQMLGPTGDLVPIEWYQLWYNAVVFAVGNGIVVVEAAGNGGADLDDQVYNAGHAPFVPENDSGAIIVGAGTMGLARMGLSTYGSTVDLQGHGSGVWTTGYGYSYNAEGPDLEYTGSFSGTSSATAIVAGVCVAVQAAVLAAEGAPLSPAELREVLVATGSPQAGTGQPIGPRPNAKAAIAWALGCPGDLNRDGMVDAADVIEAIDLGGGTEMLLGVVDRWGVCP